MKNTQFHSSIQTMNKMHLKIPNIKLLKNFLQIMIIYKRHLIKYSTPMWRFELQTCYLKAKILLCMD